MRSTLAIWLMIGLIFAPIGAIMATLIAYKEYSQHRLANGRALREALIAAVVAFVMLLGLMLAAGWALG